MAVKRVRKKPVIVRVAGPWDGSARAFEELSGFTDGGFRVAAGGDGVTAEVWDKLHSTWVGVKNDQFILEGVQGENYPISPDVLQETYEALVEAL